jgi:hypothetical protein
MNTYLSSRGYSIKKTDLQPSELSDLENKLTVKPFKNIYTKILWPI